MCRSTDCCKKLTCKFTTYTQLSTQLMICDLGSLMMGKLHSRILWERTNCAVQRLKLKLVCVRQLSEICVTLSTDECSLQGTNKHTSVHAHSSAPYATTLLCPAHPLPGRILVLPLTLACTKLTYKNL
jgi:hypothetical protein